MKQKAKWVRRANGEYDLIANLAVCYRQRWNWWAVCYPPCSWSKSDTFDTLAEAKAFCEDTLRRGLDELRGQIPTTPTRTATGGRK